MSQRKIKVKRYYSIKFLFRKERNELLEELRKYADVVNIFSNMTIDWFEITGNYYPDSALNPNEPVTDFDDIMSNYNARHLVSKPNPTKLWLGKWKRII